MSQIVSQNFSFPDPRTTEPAKRRVQRAIEMIPGLMTWTTLLGMVVFFFFLPVWAAIFVIIFDIYWIHKAFYISIFSLAGQRDVVAGKRINWWERCQNIVHPKQYRDMLQERVKHLRESLREISFFSLHERHIVKQEIRRTKKILKETVALIPREDEIMDWRDIIHVILLPTAGEPAEVIEPAIQSLVESNFPKEQMIILLATEEREDSKTRLPKVEYLKKKFDGIFRDFLVTTHIVAAGGFKGKASNAGFAARRLQKYLDARNIDYKR